MFTVNNTRNSTCNNGGTFIESEDGDFGCICGANFTGANCETNQTRKFTINEQ